jgi:adenylate cyclase
MEPYLLGPRGTAQAADFGTIVASRLGGGSHHHITATGDAVNVANRLMEVAADDGVQLAVSNELLCAAGRESRCFILVRSPDRLRGGFGAVRARLTSGSREAVRRIHESAPLVRARLLR